MNPLRASHQRQAALLDKQMTNPLNFCFKWVPKVQISVLMIQLQNLSNSLALALRFHTEFGFFFLL